METLRSDLKKILLGSTELVSKAGSLQAPSWKFPEKLAVSLDVEKTLREGQNHDTSDFILELIIDRLLMVLQCCVLELEGARGRKSPNIPLTLGSTVKKLSKCILQNTSHALDLKEQLSTKANKISFLESSFSELQREYKVLQNEFQASAAVSSTEDDHRSENLGAKFEAVMAPPVMSDVCTQTTDTAFALCAQCSTTQLGLMESAQLVTGLCERCDLKSKFSSYDWESLVKVGGLEIANWCESMRMDVEALDEKNCFLVETVEELTSERDRLDNYVHQLENRIKSVDVQLTSLKDTKTQNDADFNRSKKEFAASVASLESARAELRSRNNETKKELNASQQKVNYLSPRMAELEANYSKLEVDLHAVERREQELITAKLNLEDQLDSVIRQSHEALNDTQIELNKSKLHGQTLERKYEVMKAKQSALLSRLDTLDEECGNLQEELIQVERSREKLIGDVQQVQLQYKQIQKQLTTEQSKFSGVNQEQGRLNIQLTTLQAQLADTKEQVETERENCRLLMDYPFVKQTRERYTNHVTSLIRSQQSQRQISANTIRILLLEEQNNELRHKTMREMKERSVSEPDTFKVNHPTPLWEHELLSDIQDQQETIRKSATRRPARNTSHPQPWHHRDPEPPQHLRCQAESVPDEAFVRKSQSMGLSSSPTQRAFSSQRKLQSAGDVRDHSKLRGRLGHLVEAVAEAHRNALPSTSELGSCVSGEGGDEDCQPVDIEVYLCEKCDRMFCHAEEMHKHSLSCENWHS